MITTLALASLVVGLCTCLFMGNQIESFSVQFENLSLTFGEYLGNLEYNLEFRGN